MTELFVRAFPIVAGAVIVTVVILAIRLDRRMSRAPYSAGSYEPEQPSPLGQERTPWELKAIEDQLHLLSSAVGPAVPRYDLTATVNRLISASGLTDAQDQLPITATIDQLAVSVAKIEDQLGLAPLDEGTTRR